MPSLPSFRLTVASLAAAVLVACVSLTGPSPTNVAGVYRLEALNGRAVPDTSADAGGYRALDGRIALRADRGAERSITYVNGRSGALVPVALVGTFEVRGDEVELALHESASPTWRVRGAISGGVLTLRYPNPADGEIVERYRRE